MASQGSSSRRSLSFTKKKKTSENGGPDSARKSLSLSRSKYVRVRYMSFSKRITFAESLRRLRFCLLMSRENLLPIEFCFIFIVSYFVHILWFDCNELWELKKEWNFMKGFSIATCFKFLLLYLWLLTEWSVWNFFFNFAVNWLISCDLILIVIYTIKILIVIYYGILSAMTFSLYVNCTLDVPLLNHYSRRRR